jgi:saccharopine dehydrogenase-like NADP-dependent oxidoreductase
VDIDGVGTLESWNSDGLRTLIKTIPDVPNMIEKTLRYPGCIEYLRVLRESGFFSYDEIDIKGMKVRPIDVTARLLFPRWKLKPGEKEFTAMRIRVAGEEEGRPTTYEYNVLDHTHEVSGTLSMARTTGYTCTAAAHLVIEQKFTRKGICPPEYLGEEDDHFNYILAHLRAREVTYHVKQS